VVKETEISPSMAARLRNYCESGRGIRLPFKVKIRESTGL